MFHVMQNMVHVNLVLECHIISHWKSKPNATLSNYHIELKQKNGNNVEQKVL